MLFGRGNSSAAPTVPPTYGEKLCDAVYLVHNPEGPPEVEIIFIHGLQLSESKDAYWRTWLAKDGSQDNFWPSTWLSEKFPHSRILSLSYDAGALQTPTSGRMDMYALGESLLPQMLFSSVGIGQYNCPVMFVCHSLGGLVAKQIVVAASRRSEGSEEIQNFLMNLKAFFFYATPHGGSKLAELGAWIPFVNKGPLLEHLKVLSKENSRLSSAFDEIQRQVYNNELIFSVVAETHKTSCHGRVYYLSRFHAMVVEESSARYHDYDFLQIGADHFDVCKPTSKDDSSFKSLTQCISNVIQYQKDKLKLVSLPDYLVGMDDMRDIVCKMLRGVPIVGVVGMGGIGKTTLSKTVFISQIQSVPGYERTCFLQDVKSKESAGSVESVQKQLLKDLCGLDLGSSHIVDESHLKRIRQCIQTRKVLVVIDDVSKAATLDALQVPAFGIGNNSESKVILTSRNWQALQEHVSSLEGKIDMAFLNTSQAEELFCHYAFKLDNTDNDGMRSYFKNLAKDVAKACCGLPLSVEVISRYLGKKNALPFEVRKEIWHEALRRLGEALPVEGGDDNEILWKRLRISYDDLNDPEKSMFLDFACLFCNMSEHSSVSHLNDRSIGWVWNSRIGMQNLIDRSLIKFDESFEGRLAMHDQLRDMGRRIVKELSMQGMPAKPIEGLLLRNMTRLWEGEKILSFLNENKSSTSIQGISLEHRDVLDSGDGSSSSFEASEVPQPHTHRGRKRKIANYRYSHLRLLHLHSSGPEVVQYFIGKCWTDLHWLCLDLTHITSFHIEAIGLCTGLRVLQMKKCAKLQGLPTSIGNLVHLLELDLRDCIRLETLPESIDRLKRLKRFQLSFCQKLTGIPAGVGQLPDLEYLGLDNCWGLQSMCDFESKREYLYHLNISRCQRLGSNFQSLGNLHRLRTLLLRFCQRLMIEDLSGSLRELSQLQKLDLWGCHKLVPRDAAKWDLVTSNLTFCKRLEELRLPAISQAGLPALPLLKILWLENGLHLEELPASLGDLTRLERLRLQSNNPPCWKVPETLRNLIGLKKLRFDVGALDALPKCVEPLTLLQSLSIRDGDELLELPESLGQWSQLKKLKIWGWGSKNLEGLIQLSGLQSLQLEYCHKLEHLPERINQLFQLQILKVSKSKNLEHLPWSLGLLSQLRSIELSCCKKLKRLPESLGQLSRLERLLVCHCKNLKRLPESLVRLDRLSDLILSGCHKLELTEVGQQSLLRDLETRGCDIARPEGNEEDGSDEEDDSEGEGDTSEELEGDNLEEDDPEGLR